jgi:hypothetical protein
MLPLKHYQPTKARVKNFLFPHFMDCTDGGVDQNHDKHFTLPCLALPCLPYHSLPDHNENTTSSRTASDRSQPPSLSAGRRIDKSHEKKQ